VPTFVEHVNAHQEVRLLSFITSERRVRALLGARAIK
jgi:hypothetical protein